MHHSTWRTRRVRQLAGEEAEYDQEYVDVRLAGDLGQAVYGRRIELGLSQAEPAERAGMTLPQVSRMEGGDTVPTLPLLRRLAKALDGILNLAIDEGDSRVTFTPPTPPETEPSKAPDHDRSGAF
ncbi:helix-turn-helix domain-containing protein [Streptomyces sp. NPDC058442]|uniref:helix-turn-helix domain-containing protein n=1 Tax=Streptomyces sp. NPDC058442 TaxID=3346503 RepID=UPI00365619ED